MMFLFTSFSAVAAIAASLTIRGTNAAPLETQRLAIRQSSGNVVPGQYIVKLKDGTDSAAHQSSLPFAFSIDDVNSPIISELTGAFNGYVGQFSNDDLAALQASPDVEFIEQDQIFTTNDEQSNATWGLQSISSEAPVGSYDAILDQDYTYTYSEPTGDGVDIYIIDTGIYIAHQEFEGRATFGFAAGAMQMMDGNGHGTHCAGVAAGKTYGVAKNANLIAVKVLSDNGSGQTSDIIAGVNWVITNVQSTGRPSIASMSLGGNPSDALDAAVNQAITAGITVVVAAGNANTDATGQSPARVAAAITVAAANITNTKASFSNYGAPVDIWAPGVNVISAWPFTNDTSTKVLSGTSMATPYISGLAAYFLSQNTTMTPNDISNQITSIGQNNVLGGVPDGTANILAYNGGGSSAAQATPSSDDNSAPQASPSSEDDSTPQASPSDDDPQASPSDDDSTPQATPSSDDN